MLDTAASTPSPSQTSVLTSRRRRPGARRGLVGAVVLAVALSGLGAACGSSDDSSSTATTSLGASGTAPASETTVAADTGSGGGGSGGGSSSSGGSSGGGSAAAPVITSFTTPENIDCHNGNFQEFTVSWSTTGATRVTISIDGPGVYKEYGPSGSDSLPFNCSSSHTYLLTAYNADGAKATKQVTLQPRNAQGADDMTDDTQP